MRSLRIDGETDDAFRVRAMRAAKVARALVDACLANEDIQAMIADPAIPFSLESMRQSPVVRIEYEPAVAIGGIGECLRVTRSKNWAVRTAARAR